MEKTLDDGWLTHVPGDEEAPDAPGERKRRKKKSGGSRPPPRELPGRELCAVQPYREKLAANLAIKVLAEKADDVYQRAGSLVRVVEEPRPSGDGPVTAAAPRISPLPKQVLRERLDEFLTIQTPNKSGDLVESHPPAWFVDLIDARGLWPGIRRLESVTQCPVLRPNGSVVETPGYDEATGVLYSPNAAFLPVPTVPTREDALAALAELEDVVCDFPFVEPKHLAGWVSLLLTPFARMAFRGPAPLGIIDGSVAGVGKGKLAQVISILLDGVAVAPTPQPEEVEEERKMITSIAMAGRRLVLIDNVTRPVGSGPLEALLTATRWSDRVLGASKMFEGDVLASWLVTGNNVAFRKRDTIRRCVYVRVEARTDSPESRSQWAHDPLLEWVEAERPRLVRAALTVLRAHAVAGFPQPCRSQWGSFEGWSDRVRAPLVWLGRADPADTRTEITDSSDMEAVALRVVLELMFRRQALRPEGMSTRDLIDEAANAAEVRDALDELCPSRREMTPRALGYALRAVKGRVVTVDGRALQLAAVSGPHHSTMWAAVEVAG